MRCMRTSLVRVARGTLVLSVMASLTLAGGCGKSAEAPQQAVKVAEQSGEPPVAKTGESAAATNSEPATPTPTATAEAAKETAAATARQEPPRPPATVDEARAVFDLAAIPLADGAEKPGERSLANLFYACKASAADAFAFHREQLLQAGWKELPGGYTSAESSNGTFARDGYLLSLSVSGGQGAPGESATNVFIVNHGNVDTTRLPVPDGAKPFYQAPVSTAYITEKPVEEIAAAVRKLLMEQGWQPYGAAGDQQFYKQNAIRLSANVSSAPAQDNKTVITFSTELMSADIPAPAEFLDAQYSDSTKTLAFDTSESIEAVAKYYVEKLGKSGWTPTTEKPLEIDWKRVLIFRNEAKDLMELEAHEVDGKTRATVEFQTAAEVAEMDRLVKAEQERLRREREAEENKPKPTVAIAVPEGAENVELDETELKFNVANGQAAAAYEAIRRQLIADGWEEEQETKDANLGHASLRKDEHSVTVTFVETGILPSEVTVSGFGVQVLKAE